MERLVEELQEPKEPKEPKEPSAPKKKATVAKKGPQVLTPEESSSNANPPQPALTASTFSTQVSPASYPPSPASSSPRTAKPYYAGASEGTVGTAGSCSLFSAEGIAKIDTLVGDNRYSDAVYYFIFSAENHIAVSILALATQFILLAGYHNPDHPNKVLGHPADVLHRRRLFWQAYVLDHDLMLRIGKPPLISDDFLLELPEEFPADGYGVYYYPGDVTLSYFHQQVRLSQIQGHIYSKLYSQGGEIMSAAALESTIAQLDAELQDWWTGVPELIRPEPQMDLLDADYTKVMSLTVLNFMYFQLVVAIHSAAFRLPLLDEDDDGLRPSVALCVNAARAAIALLKHQQLQHPFTM
ncbi:hypothetical protein N0V92_012860 [Colletotrichum tropicale]|nr:hypothetical protein N0V92_012860 [Colletotrichum tropicale]